MFAQMKLMEFSLVDDEAQYIEHASLKNADKLEYGCGLFIFKKL
jgi:hypothetical protein